LPWKSAEQQSWSRKRYSSVAAASSRITQNTVRMFVRRLVKLTSVVPVEMHRGRPFAASGTTFATATP
jgi:hypothetical protein